VHLKSLTLKGFKSFASATTLRFESGITAVVGPNGSGKSNVVDAIAWVLGEQGAKTLRGGKMEDVIFAGTAGRPPLGRAEVILTIDNSDGVLPIDYAEVSITRRMFRDGASEYEINGESVRLLDIQELLSDSGIGREMHVIVGQGQLDSVLSARPDERRGVIEEAAGVLKHRKRKEKALRKLDAMQANLTRLADLTDELRRQLKPLGRQAEIARRAAGVQAELRDSRLRLLADDLTTLYAARDDEVADETAIRERRALIETDLTEGRRRETDLEQALAADAPVLARAQETYYRLTALQERFRGTASLAAERGRHLASLAREDHTGPDPDQLTAEADELRASEAALNHDLEAARTQLHATVETRMGREAELAAAERAVVAAAQAAGDRRESIATLTGRVNALRTRATAAGEELARLRTAADGARDRVRRSERELELVHEQVGLLDEGEVGLDERHEAVAQAHHETVERVSQLTDAVREAERDRSTWTARRDALALGLTRRDGAGALLAAGSRRPGVLGSVAALLTVEPGREAALAAALGAVADAVAVSSVADAGAALRLLKAEDGGRAGLIVGGRPRPLDRSEWPPLPAGATWAVDLVRAPDVLRGAIDRALAQVAVVDVLDDAERLLAQYPGIRIATAGGDVLGPDWAAGGSPSAPSAMEIQAAVDEAQLHADEAGARQERIQAELQVATARAAQLASEVDAALSALNESDARLAAVAEQLAQLGAASRSAAAEANRLDEAGTAAARARDRDVAGLADLEERLRLAELEPVVDGETALAARDALRDAAAEARGTELDARLAVRTSEERVRAIAGRADGLMQAANEERAARREHEQARHHRARGAAVAEGVHDLAREVCRRVEQSAARAAAERDAVQQAHAQREAELVTVRTRSRELDEEIVRLTDALHRDEIARAEHRLRIETLETRVLEEYGVSIEALVAEYGPDQPAPPSSQEMAEFEQARDRGEQVSAPQPGPFDRRAQEKRAARADRDLALLGRVNPLALEEFAALEERHQFLSTQLEDLKATRRDLLTVVKEVDERILEVFTSAFQDVAAEFETVFATLFPGGEGRLVLTDPDDLLHSGVDVEARPPGKKVKRLSLLSGGERSLTAVALLVAIFRARPSPFYVLDEVEAALDEVNLGRLVGLVDELRVSSQLIVITHQKRTMEIADALYGVTMRGDGITQVISQRLRDINDEPAVHTTRREPVTFSS
jgi:chromosome segregation protein